MGTRSAQYLGDTPALVPYLAAAGELKTKPAQHSVKSLMQAGVQAGVLVCRTEHHLPQEVKNKLAQFCNVRPAAVIESIDAETIYDVPILMEQQQLDRVVLEDLGLPCPDTLKMDKWLDFLRRYKNPKGEVTNSFGRKIRKPARCVQIDCRIVHTRPVRPMK